MRLKQHAPRLQSTIRRTVALSTANSLCNRCRRYASSAAYPEKIAVLGGGISGLASAYFAAKEFPKSIITIYEASSRVGGWIHSSRVDVPGGGNVLFEYGCRTLRPGPTSMPTAQIVSLEALGVILYVRALMEILKIQDLGLTENLLTAKKTSVGAKNRYIYYPDRLNRMPGGEAPSLTQFLELYQSGILAGSQSILTEVWKPQRSSRIVDESIGSFLSRRLDKRMVQNIISGVFHGIYAGDVWKLSARTLLGQAWQLESTYGGIFRGLYELQISTQESGMILLGHPLDIEDRQAMYEETDVDKKLKIQLYNSSVFSFRNGIQELVNALQRNLEENPQVEIRLDTPIQSYNMVKSGEQEVEVIAGVRLSPSPFSCSIPIIPIPILPY
jgi:oxygen-dependent protoporphyrinogen oxidase